MVSPTARSTISSSLVGPVASVTILSLKMVWRHWARCGIGPTSCARTAKSSLILKGKYVPGKGNHFVRDVTSGCPARFGRRLKSSRISKPKWNGRPKRNKCVRPVVLSLRPGRLPSLQPKNSMVPKEKYQLGLVLWLAVSCGQRCQVQTKKLFHGHDRITLPPPRNCELHGDVPISQSSWVVQEDQSQRK